METLQDQADAGVPYAIEALDKAPTEYNEFYWWAFSELATERQIGMAVGAIPSSAIRAFCDKHRITGYERNVFHHCMRELDIVQRKHIKKKSDNAAKAK